MAGVAVGWLTAPRKGSRARSQMRQTFIHWQRVGERGVEKGCRDLSHRIRGSVARMRGRLSEARRSHAAVRQASYVDANTLVDQVHSQLGREFSRAFKHVNLNAVGHTLVLHGYVDSEPERTRLIEAIEDLNGVEAVDARELRIRHAGAELREFPRRHA